LHNVSENVFVSHICNHSLCIVVIISIAVAYIIMLLFFSLNWRNFRPLYMVAKYLLVYRMLTVACDLCCYYADTFIIGRHHINGPRSHCLRQTIEDNSVIKVWPGLHPKLRSTPLYIRPFIERGQKLGPPLRIVLCSLGLCKNLIALYRCRTHSCNK